MPEGSGGKSAAAANDAHRVGAGAVTVLGAPRVGVSTAIGMGVAQPVPAIALRFPPRSIDEIHARLASEGIKDLSKLGKITLQGPQSWTGANFLRADRPFTITKDRIIEPIPVEVLAGALPPPKVGPIRIPIGGSSAPALIGPRGVSVAMSGGVRRRAVSRVAPTRTSRVAVSIDEFWVAADEIVLAADLDAVIRVPMCVVLVANRILVEPGSRITWAPTLPGNFDDPGVWGPPGTGSPGAGDDYSASGPPAGLRGGAGPNGHQGKSGNRGPDAPDLEVVTGEMTRLPRIDLPGYRGGTGGRGQDGGNGGNGARGVAAKCSRLGYRKYGPGYGGNGGPGGSAGCGGVGGQGGNPGSIFIWCPEESRDAVTIAPLAINVQPGMGGPGGPPGTPGQGGGGAWRGSMCGPNFGQFDDRVGVSGPSGSPCMASPASLEGASGAGSGELRFSIITKDYLIGAFNQPAIVNLEIQARSDDPAAEPEDTIALYGANIPPGVKVRLADTTLVGFSRDSESKGTFVLPKAIRGGSILVELTNAAGSPISNRAGIIVRPRIDAVRGIGRWGTTLEIDGAGFTQGSSLQIGPPPFRDCDADFVSSVRLRVELPRPRHAFEQPSEDRPLQVANPDGWTSRGQPPVLLHFEHWLDLGFNPELDGFSFDNSADELGSVPDSIIDLDLFEQTFGEDDMDTLSPDDVEAIIGAVLNPVNTGVGWLFFLAYKAFLKSRPGVCSAWSALALDRFFGGGPPLSGQYAHMTELARDLFATQGRVLSHEIIENGLSYATQPGVGEGIFLDRLETVLREIVAGGGSDSARKYPLLNFLAKTTWNLKDYWDRVPDQHVIIPYAIRYPETGESFLARVYCCNNWDERHVRVDFERNGTFRAREFSGGAGQDPYDAGATYTDLKEYRTDKDWIVGPLPMRYALYDDVDIPTRVLGILSPVQVVLEDAKGRKLGVGRENPRRTSSILPLPYLEKFFVIGKTDRVKVTASGSHNGSYKCGFFDADSGFGAFSEGITAKKGKKDTLVFDIRRQEVRFHAGGADSNVRVWTNQRDLKGTRRAVLTEPALRKGQELVLASPSNGSPRPTFATQRAVLDMSVKPRGRGWKSLRTPLGGSKAARTKLPTWDEVDRRGSEVPSTLTSRLRATKTKRGTKKRRGRG